MDVAQLRALTAVAMLFSSSGALANDNDPDSNLQIILEAVEGLEFALPENRAYLLEKQETIRSPVAVIWGYVDNEAACAQIARILSQSGEAGTFECVPIY